MLDKIILQQTERFDQLRAAINNLALSKLAQELEISHKVSLETDELVTDYLNNRVENLAERIYQIEERTNQLELEKPPDQTGENGAA